MSYEQKGYPPAQQQAYPPQQGYPPQQQGGYPGPPQAQYNPNNPPTQTVIVRQTQGSAPSDYMAFAIITTICCCLPLGIVAIVQASNVKSRWASGDVAGAEEASRSAKCWSIAALVTGIVLYLIGVVVVILYVVFWVAVVTTAVDNLDNIDFGSIDFGSTFNNN